MILSSSVVAVITAFAVLLPGCTTLLAEGRNIAPYHLPRQIPGIPTILPPDPEESDSSTTTRTTTSTTSTVQTTSTTTTRPSPRPSSSSTSSSSSSSSSTRTTSSTSTTSTSSSTRATSTARVTQAATTNALPSTARQSTRTQSSTLSELPTETADDDSGGSFLENKGAVAATFTVVGLVGVGILAFVLFTIKKRRERENEFQDTWDDNATMAEFTSASVLPPATSGSLHRSADHSIEDTEAVLAMPPVAHYDRPRDSAFDIVPAGPPMRGNTSSYGGAYGNDPFANPAQWQDGVRDSAYGPGEAGRGAGGGYVPQPAYNMAPYQNKPSYPYAF